MKGFLKLYKPNMRRPVVNKVITRFVTGLTLALLWDRFFNTEKLFSMAGYAFFVLGAFFFALAWFNYLKLDGVKILPVKKGKKEQPKPRHKMRLLIDFIWTKPSPTDTPLDDDEESAAALLANLVTGLCFLLPAIAVSVLK